MNKMRPIHPGEVLRDEFLEPLGLTAHALAQALRLRAGDELVYQIDEQRVILTKAGGGSKTDDPFRTFSEWSSEADTKGYRKL